MNNLSENSIKRCAEFRLRILEISQQVDAIHIGSAFSCLEIVDSIYFELMKCKEKNLSADKFILSKGHGCMIQYVILEKLKILSKNDIANYCKSNGILGVHPDYGNPGILASTGSLGHGLSIACGVAYAQKINNNNSNVHCVISDGELQEGSSWEAILFASSHQLNNLICYVDNNNFQSLERTNISHPSFYPLIEKFNAFGWKTFEIDGHNTNEIKNSFANRSQNSPTAIICKTIKGKGVSYMENVPIWHYRSPNEEEYKIALNEIMEVLK